MNRTLTHLVLVLGFGLVACARPSERPAATAAPDLDGAVGPRLVGEGARWFVTGLSEDAAGLVEQGRIFAVLRPIPGTVDSEEVAVMKTLGPAHEHSVQVAPQCVTPGTRLSASMPVAPLASGTSRKVGPCLARVVATGTGEHGESYVVLDVGSGFGLQPGDQYALLGQAITRDGHVPLVLDTQRDGICQVPLDTTHLKISTARCEIVEFPFGTANVDRLERSFAAWMAR